MELMMVVAVTGILSLAIMTLFSETAKTSHQLQTQMELERGLETFMYTMEQYVGQTVQVVACRCVPDGGAGAGPCHNTADLATEATDATDVFEFVYENASDPKSFPGPGCIFNTSPGSAIAGSGIVPLGCKRVMKLRYTKPTLTNASGTTPATRASQPGKLELIWTQPVAAAGAGGTVVATLENITKFACGMSENSAASSLSNSDLRMRIEVKAKANSTTDINNSQYETWSPDPTDSKASTFNRGYRRQFMTQVFFRNLTTPGIQFGKPRQIKNCLADGATANAGETSKCCSGYRNPTTNKCLEPTGSATGANSGVTCTNSGVAAPGGVADMCCSKMMSTAGSLCI